MGRPWPPLDQMEWSDSSTRDRLAGERIRPGDDQNVLGGQNARDRLDPAKQDEAIRAETLPSGASLVSLEVLPKEIRLNNRFAYVQLLVTGKLATGETLDVTRMVEFRNLRRNRQACLDRG